MSNEPQLPTLERAALLRYDALRRDAAESVTQRFYAAPGGIYEDFGPRGREACREDIDFHLDFLRPVLEFGFAQSMVDYLRWLAGVLEARDVPAGHLSLSLDWLGEFFGARMDAADAAIVVRALGEARDQYLAAPALAAEGPEPSPECEALERALLAGERSRAQAFLDRYIAAGRTLVDGEMHLVQPALYAIGRKWENNRVTVAQEHLATAIAQTIMTRSLAAESLAPPNGRAVLLACVEGNDHCVGLQMLSDAFQLSGWTVQYLGANVPTASLAAHVRQSAPDLLGLSVSFAHQLRVVKDLMARLGEGPRPRVFIGGLAINRFPGLATRLGADAWYPDARSAVAGAASLAGN